MHTKKLYQVWLCVSMTSIIYAASSSSYNTDETITSDVSATSLHSYIPVKQQKKLRQGLELVRSKKIDLNQQDEQGNTCLHLVIPHISDQRTVRLAYAMLRHGALVSIVNKQGKTPRDLAQEHKRALSAEKIMHEGDLLHGDQKHIVALEHQIVALTYLFEGIAPVSPNAKIAAQTQGRFYLTEPTPAIPARKQVRVRSAKPCS